MDNSDPRRDKLREFLQEQGHPAQNGAVLTGWVVITEWMLPDGNKVLTRGWDAALSGWHAEGMMHRILYGATQEIERDIDEDED